MGLEEVEALMMTMDEVEDLSKATRVKFWK